MRAGNGGGKTIKFPRAVIFSGLLLLLLFASIPLTAQPARKKNAPPADAPITPEEAAKLEAVIKTELGAMRMEFYPDKAPLHVSSFIKNARAGIYDGTSFFRVFAHSLVQGGDPSMKESLPRNRWGAGVRWR